MTLCDIKEIFLSIGHVWHMAIAFIYYRQQQKKTTPECYDSDSLWSNEITLTNAHEYFKWPVFFLSFFYREIGSVIETLFQFKNCFKLWAQIHTFLLSSSSWISLWCIHHLHAHSQDNSIHTHTERERQIKWKINIGINSRRGNSRKNCKFPKSQKFHRNSSGVRKNFMKKKWPNSEQKHTNTIGHLFDVCVCVSQRTSVRWYALPSYAFHSLYTHYTTHI